MTLTERLLKKDSNGHITAAAPVSSMALVSQRRESADTGETAAFRDLKAEIFEHLLQKLDVAKMESLDPSLVTARFGVAITDYLRERGRLVTDADRLRLIEEVKNEILGLGPL